jgi:hypothetical protein
MVISLLVTLTTVTEKQVNDFFSFCGKIQSLKLESDGGMVPGVLLESFVFCGILETD